MDHFKDVLVGKFSIFSKTL